MYRDHPHIAAEHNNEDDLIMLHKIDAECQLFRHYDDWIEVAWTEYEGVEMSADRRRVPIGLPSASWIFPLLSDRELSYLRDNYCPGMDALVTIRTFDLKRQTWNNYNATMIYPDDARFDGFEWRDVTIQFIDLVEL